MEPFIGQIQLFGFNFNPRGWAKCDGQLLPISQNTALFSLLGTTYGGDGRTTFALPDLRGRFPTSQGTGPGLSGRSIGQKSGTESNTLNANNLPPHTHQMRGNEEGNTDDPTGNVVAGDGTNAFSNISNVDMGATSITGNSDTVNNMPPYLVLNYCIALTGIFPSRN